MNNETTPDDLEMKCRECAEKIDTIYHSTAHAQDGTTRQAIVASLLRFVRERETMAREGEAYNCMSLFRGNREINDVYILIHDRTRELRNELHHLQSEQGSSTTTQGNAGSE